MSAERQIVEQVERVEPVDQVEQEEREEEDERQEGEGVREEQVEEEGEEEVREEEQEEGEVEEVREEEVREEEVRDVREVERKERVWSPELEELKGEPCCVFRACGSTVSVYLDGVYIESKMWTRGVWRLDEAWPEVTIDNGLIEINYQNDRNRDSILHPSRIFIMGWRSMHYYHDMQGRLHRLDGPSHARIDGDGVYRTYWTHQGVPQSEMGEGSFVIDRINRRVCRQGLCPSIAPSGVVSWNGYVSTGRMDNIEEDCEVWVPEQ